MKLAEAVRSAQHEEVLELLEEGEELGELQPLAPQIKATALLHLHQPEKALQLLENCAQKSAEVVYLQAYALCSMKKYADALAICESSAEARVRLLRAVCHLSLEQYAPCMAEALAVVEEEAPAHRDAATSLCASALALLFAVGGSSAREGPAEAALAHLRSVAAVTTDVNVLAALTAAVEVGAGAEVRQEAEGLLARLSALHPLDPAVRDATALQVYTLHLRLREPHYCTEAEFEKLGALLGPAWGRDFDPRLRLSLLSGILRFMLSHNRSSEARNMLGFVEEALKQLPRGSRVTRALAAQVACLKAAVPLGTCRAAEGKQALRPEARPPLSAAALGVELGLAVQSGRQHELLQRAHALLSGGGLSPDRIRAISAVLELAFTQKLNFQKKYIELLLRFMRQIFLPQLRLPAATRFLTPAAFAQFARSVFAQVLRCGPALRELRSELAAFTELMAEPELAAQVAEGCLGKGDHTTAQQIYEALLQRHPAQTIYSSRLNVIYSVTDPARIDAALLPDFELITDTNALRDLENDYQRLLRTEETDKGGGPVQPRKRGQRKRRIRWPKNFDFEAPGPRPDAERWLPKAERSRFRRRALKKATTSRTQGATNVSKNSTEMFAAAHSTAARAAASASGKKTR